MKKQHLRVYSGFKLGLFLLICMVTIGIAVPGKAEAAGSISLDAPAGGYVSDGGLVEIGGSYTDLYDIRLFVDGTAQFEVVLNDPDGDDSGTWSYMLDTSAYNGAVELVVRGLDTSTRYGVWG